MKSSGVSKRILVQVRKLYWKLSYKHKKSFKKMSMVINAMPPRYIRINTCRTTEFGD